MNDDLIRYYELLGVAPGVSAQELKTAHRDLAKVWHPDRFAHDPRLQQKAQDKLKEVNEAYDRLISAKTGRQSPVTSSSSANHSRPSSQASARPVRQKMVLLPALLFAILIFVAYRTLIPASKPSVQSDVQFANQSQAPLNETGQQADGIIKSRAIDSSPAKRTGQPGAGEMKTGDQPVFEQEIRQVRPLPTVTLTIDPVSGLLAKPECPTKSRMTYPSGSEPHQYCNVAHRSDAPEQADEVRPKESRLKSFTKRIRSLGGKGGSEAESSRPEAKTSAAGDQRNR